MRTRSMCLALVLLTAYVFFLERAVDAQRAGGAGANAASPPIGIDGRTIDAQGRAVPHAFLTLLQADRSGVMTPISRDLSTVSGKDGRFVFDDLRPGSYVVVAWPSYFTGEALLGQPRGYRTTYFPSAADVARATPVAVTFKGRTTAVITMLAARFATVSGTVTLANGKPSKGGSLHVARGDGFFGFDSYRVPANDDGTFTATQLPPGTFFLQLREAPWPPPTGQASRVSGARVVVQGADIAGVRVTPIPVLTVHGRVVVNSAERATLRASEVRLALTPMNFEGNPGPTLPTTLQGDLSFALRAHPARVRVRVTFPDRQWQVDAIRLDGVDVTTAGFDLQAGRPVGRLEITLKRATSK